MVGVTRFKLNTELARFVRDHSSTQREMTHNRPTSLYYTPPRRPRRLQDLINETEVTSLIAAFKAGTPKHELAKQYGIGLGSVKKLLREHGVKKRSRYDIQA